MSVRPNFLIVGAPKCGTTAMANYLKAHPEIFVAERKDLHFFGSDLNFTRRERLSKTDYLANFAEAGQAACVGEASVWYLYSKHAAEEIAAFDQNMRIIVMLRNPVDMMHALYTQLCFNGLGDEDLPTFAEALQAEEARRSGQRIPANTPLPEALFYRQTARFSVQLARFQKRFPPQQLCVVLQDDLKADVAATYKKVLTFLSVDDTFVPDLRVVNSHKEVRSEPLRRLIARTPGSAKSWIPKRLRRPLRRKVHKLNSRHAKRPALDPTLRASLVSEFQAEVQKLSQLIGRDLTSWSDV